MTDAYIDPSRLTAFLDQHGIGEGTLTFRRIGDGQSNLTFLIERSGVRLALRRGPRPPFPPSAHDMLREARMVSALAEHDVPVPVVRATCADEAVLGVPFYVMDFLDGVIITDELPPQFDDEDQRRRLCEALVDALVSLHDVDVHARGVSELGRPSGYLRRQIERFGEVHERVATRGLPEVVSIARWLDAHLPAESGASVVHGDFRMGNLMFDRAIPVVVGILDWEMATLGDPLADLGYLVATYPEPGSQPTPLDLSPVTRGSGFLRRDDLIERYSRRSGRDVERLDWYQVLALWKAAVFCEAIYTRWLAGERPDDHTFAPQLRDGVPRLLALARATGGIRSTV